MTSKYDHCSDEVKARLEGIDRALESNEPLPPDWGELHAEIIRRRHEREELKRERQSLLNNCGSPDNIAPDDNPNKPIVGPNLPNDAPNPLGATHRCVKLCVYSTELARNTFKKPGFRTLRDKIENDLNAAKYFWQRPPNNDREGWEPFTINYKIIDIGSEYQDDQTKTFYCDDSKLKKYRCDDTESLIAIYYVAASVLTDQNGTGSFDGWTCDPEKIKKIDPITNKEYEYPRYSTMITIDAHQYVLAHELGHMLFAGPHNNFSSIEPDKDNRNTDQIHHTGESNLMNAKIPSSNATLTDIQLKAASNSYQVNLFCRDE